MTVDLRLIKKHFHALSLKLTVTEHFLKYWSNITVGLFVRCHRQKIAEVTMPCWSASSSL